MTSKERILAVMSGEKPDHVPLTTWCFGVQPPASLRWKTDGREVKHWYSLRMEHIHTMPEPWALEDDFRRAQAWLSLGADDILDVSVPWSHDPAVTWKDSLLPPRGSESHSVAVREYQSPAGPLRHAVRITQEDQGPGWVIQPEQVQLFEDLNIPRAVEHAVSKPSDVPVIKHLYAGPDAAARSWFGERMAQVKAFAEREGVLVQAWSAFGMDGAVWLTGAEGAVMMAMDEPEAFAELLDTIQQTDLARTELAVSMPGVDMIVMRGWYSSTDFWSPRLVEQLVYPRVAELVALAHRQGKKFAYTVTTGVDYIGPRLADAGVDMIYFVDPVQGGITLERSLDLFADRISVAGGINTVTLTSGTRDQIRASVRNALEVLGPTNRFIMHPVDALFPDTPWDGIEAMIEAWREYR